MSETGPYHPGQESFHPLESIKLGPYRRGQETLRLQSPSMSWGVYDFTTLTAISFSADGGHFTSVPGRRYLVTLRVEDTLGIEKVALDGSGKFEAWTDDDPTKQTGTHKAPELLPASIQHQEFDNRGMAPRLQSLIVIMSPDIGAWEYDRLSCGVHAWSGVQEEYFAVSGLMMFSGTSSNVVGRSSSASLTTSP